MFGWAGILIGVLMVVVGIFMAFFSQVAVEHQPQDFGYLAIGIGIILIFAGGALIFL